MFFILQGINKFSNNGITITSYFQKKKKKKENFPVRQKATTTSKIKTKREQLNLNQKVFPTMKKRNIKKAKKKQTMIFLMIHCRP